MGPVQYKGLCLAMPLSAPLHSYTAGSRERLGMNGHLARIWFIFIVAVVFEDELPVEAVEIEDLLAVY